MKIFAMGNCCAVGAIVLLPIEAVSQTAIQGNDAAAVSRDVRANRKVWRVRPLLLKEGELGQQITDAVRERIADSLVAIAKSDDGRSGIPSQSLTDEILELFGDAGAMRRGASRYVAAETRLIEIADAAPEYFHLAMMRLTRVTAPTRVLAQLAKAAIGANDTAAFAAVSMLYSDVGPEGRAKLRELFLSRRVTAANAKYLIDYLGALQKWDVP